MIKLNKIPKSENVQCEILAKCEFLLPGGSIKDRIGKRMISDAEKKGLIKENGTIIEATSGNTGIALSLVGVVKDYKVAVTMTEKISHEKSDILNALGAKVYRTSNDAKYYEPDSHIGIARKLNREIENSFFTQQYSNESNALVHYDQTAEEIYDQCEGKVDYVVIATGTGGTLTGIGRKLKEKIPNVKVKLLIILFIWIIILNSFSMCFYI
jgi:cystathionine beta-synthase